MYFLLIILVIDVYYFNSVESINAVEITDLLKVVG